MFTGESVVGGTEAGQLTLVFVTKYSGRRTADVINERRTKRRYMRGAHAVIAREAIEGRIYLLRGEKVMLSKDLARLYQVAPRVLAQAVKRNVERFPEDFMFQLTMEEFEDLKSQIVISSATGHRGARSADWGGLRRAAPYAFAEQGVAMLSSVLRSKRAVRVNIEIMRAFVRSRRLLVSNEDLARRLTALEKRYGAQFKVVFDAIRELMTPPDPVRHRIGF